MAQELLRVLVRSQITHIGVFPSLSKNIEKLYREYRSSAVIQRGCLKSA